MGVKLKKSKKPFMSVIKVTCNRYRTDNGCANFKMMQFPRTCTARAPFLYCAAIRTSVQALERPVTLTVLLGAIFIGRIAPWDQLLL